MPPDLQAAASASDKQPVGLHASQLRGAEPHVDGGRAQSAGGIRQPHRAAGDRDADDRGIVGCQHATAADQTAAGLLCLNCKLWTVSAGLAASVHVCSNRLMVPLQVWHLRLHSSEHHAQCDCISLHAVALDIKGRTGIDALPVGAMLGILWVAVALGLLNLARPPGHGLRGPSSLEWDAESQCRAAS